MSYYEKPERPSNDDLWRRRFPVTVLANNESDAFAEANKFAYSVYDRKKFSVPVMVIENRGSAVS